MHRFEKRKTRTSESKECNGMESSERERWHCECVKERENEELCCGFWKAFERLHIILKQYRLFRLRLETWIVCVCSFVPCIRNNQSMLVKCCYFCSKNDGLKSFECKQLKFPNVCECECEIKTIFLFDKQTLNRLKSYAWQMCLPCNAERK